jgi:uncharacterized protein (DUF433 family)
MIHNFPRLEIPLPEFIVADADGWVHFQGHRVGLSHLVQAYRDGYSPEMLASEYPPLSLATIHKSIAVYLEHRDAVDCYLNECTALVTSQSENASPAPSLDELRKRLSERILAK